MSTWVHVHDHRCPHRASLGWGNSRLWEPVQDCMCVASVRVPVLLRVEATFQAWKRGDTFLRDVTLFRGPTTISESWELMGTPILWKRKLKPRGPMNCPGSHSKLGKIRRGMSQTRAPVHVLDLFGLVFGAWHPLMATLHQILG